MFQINVVVAFIKFLWEWIVGKDIKTTGTVLTRKKITIIITIISWLLVYSYHVTKVSVKHYTNYKEQMDENKELLEDKNYCTNHVNNCNSINNNLTELNKELIRENNRLKYNIQSCVNRYPDVTSSFIYNSVEDKNINNE